MRIGIYPGSFDPVTTGHMDMIERARGMFDVLVVGVLENIAKKSAFTVAERVEMLEKLTKDKENIRIESFDGLLIDFARKNNAKYIVRGLRNGTDFDYEMQLAHGNNKLASEIETVFLLTKTEHSYISSSGVKDIAIHGGRIEGFVPDSILQAVYDKFK